MTQHWEGIRPDLDRIPSELAHIDQWVVWKAVPKPGGGMNKIPYQPNGRKASSSDPATWADFGAAWGAYEEAPGEYAGVGFVLSGEDEFIGGDLDHCRNPETGALDERAAKILKGLVTYWEISPSGTGLRFIARGEQVKAFKGHGIEVYFQGRFLTITGERVGDLAEPQNVDARLISRLRELARPGNGHDKPDTKDRVVAALESAGLYQRSLQDGRHSIVCPWWEEHTGGDKTGTVYMEPHFNGHATAQFVCQHSHCGNRRLGDLLQFLDIDPEPTAEPPAPFPFIYPPDFRFDKAQYAVDGWLPRGGVHILYAPKGTLKSFVCVDAFMSVVTGNPWHGHEIPEAGLGVYIAGEGNLGLQRRMKGWCCRHGAELDGLPLALSRVPVQVLGERSGLDKWKGHLQAVEEHFQREIGFVVVDTMSTNFGAGEENSSSDVAQFLSLCRLYLKPHDGTTVLLVHHTGKDISRGARGASAIEANTDAIFTIMREKEKPAEDAPDEEMDIWRREVTLVCKENKDDIRPENLRLKAVPIDIAPGVSTLVLDDGLTDREGRILNQLRYGHSQRQIAELEKISQQAVCKISRKLKRMKLVDGS